METNNRTLNILMQTLESNNQLIGWNMYQNKSGHVILKIRFDDHKDVNKTDSMNERHSENKISTEHENNVPNDMTPKQERNYFRAKAFRVGNPLKRQRLTTSSPELPRNCDNFVDSETVPGSFDQSTCLSSESLTRGQQVNGHLADCSLIQSEVGDEARHHGHSTYDQHPVASYVDYDAQQCVTEDMGVQFDKWELKVSELDHSTPTPFDGESDYDPDEILNHPTEYSPCNDPECFYGQEPYEQFKEFPLKRNIYTCNLCGRKVCNECAYAKRRHFLHSKHMRNYSFELPDGRPLAINLLKQGVY